MKGSLALLSLLAHDPCAPCFVIVNQELGSASKIKLLRALHTYRFRWGSDQ